jgi:CRP-like cAMP-binding protein
MYLPALHARGVALASPPLVLGRSAIKRGEAGATLHRYMIAPVPTVVDELAQVKLFSCLNQRQLRRLAKSVQVREFRPGVAIVTEGSMSGVGFFIVAEGEASVSVDGREVARIGPGDHFGELALITEDVRTATVTAITRLRCHVIQFWDFRRFAKENPDVSWSLLQHVAGLLTGERERRAKAALLDA